jgi:hypothetical protein
VFLGAAVDGHLDARTEHPSPQRIRRCHREKAAAQHADSIGESFGLVEVVRRDDDAVPGGAQLSDHLTHVACALRIQARRGLVE